MHACTKINRRQKFFKTNKHTVESFHAQTDISTANVMIITSRSERNNLRFMQEDKLYLCWLTRVPSRVSQPEHWSAQLRRAAVVFGLWCLVSLQIHINWNWCLFSSLWNVNTTSFKQKMKKKERKSKMKNNFEIRRQSKCNQSRRCSQSWRCPHLYIFTMPPFHNVYSLWCHLD